MSGLDATETQDVRQAIDRPEAVLLVRLTTTNIKNSNKSRRCSDVAVANVHVTWSQLKYPALQALQVALSLSLSLSTARLSFMSNMIVMK